MVTSTLDEDSSDESIGFGNAMTLSYSPLCASGFGYDTTTEQCVECHEQCQTCYGPLDTQCLTCFTDGNERLTFQAYDLLSGTCADAASCTDNLSGANGCPEYGCTNSFLTF